MHVSRRSNLGQGRGGCLVPLSRAKETPKEVGQGLKDVASAVRQIAQILPTMETQPAVEAVTNLVRALQQQLEDVSVRFN